MKKEVCFFRKIVTMSTSDMVNIIAKVCGKKVKFVKLFNPLLKMLRNRVGIVNKVFGDLVYEQSLSEYPKNYRIRSFKESIRLTEL